jgi:integral membrane protein
MTPRLDAALKRFRVAAYVVGVLLLVLVVVAMPLKYVFHSALLVAVVGPLHGFLYMGYLVLAFDLAVRARWSPLRTVLVLLAGVVPVMSFVAERKVTRWVTATGPSEMQVEQKVHSAP